MPDSEHKELTAQDMFAMIDKEVGDQISTLVQLKTESPFQLLYSSISLPTHR